MIPTVRIPWQLAVALGVLLAGIGWGELRHYQGKKEVQSLWDASTEKGKVILAQMKRDYESVPPAVITIYDHKTEVIRERGETLTKLVPHYIPADSCELPGGFRLLHDAAVAKSTPTAAGGTEAQPVPAQTAAATVIGNYTACYAEQEKLIAMWDWVEKIQAEYDKLCEQDGVKCEE